MTDSIIGKGGGAAGPANIYVKPQSVSSWDVDTGWISLGLTQAITWKDEQKKIELKASQKGDKPFNRVETAFDTTFSTSLAEAEVERAEVLLPNLSVTRNLGGDPIQLMGVPKLGQADSDNLMWLKIVELNGTVESTDPLDTVYSLVAPSTPTIENSFDNVQRFLAVSFSAYANEDPLTQVKDADGQLANWWTGLGT